MAFSRVALYLVRFAAGAEAAEAEAEAAEAEAEEAETGAAFNIT